MPTIKKTIFERELREGEARLQLQALSEREQQVGPFVEELQRRIEHLVQECDALKVNPPRKVLPGVWMTDGVPPPLQEVPPIPSDQQDLEAWLNALEFWRRRDHGQSGSFGGTRICENGHVCARRAHEWSGEIFFDVSSDR